MHCLYFHSDTKALDKKFNLRFLERSKEKALSYGKERTFFLSQFEEGKIYEVDIGFQYSSNGENLANLKLKLQYVKDEENLIENILDLYENKRKLLSLLLKKCIEQINGISEGSDKGDNPQDENSCKSDDNKMNLLNKVKQQSMISWGTSNKTQSFVVNNEPSLSKGISIIDNSDKISCFSFGDKMEYRHNKTPSKNHNDDFFKMFPGYKSEDKGGVRMFDLSTN
mmetsp:Transcript_8412/g.7435  ORF Transcript_8412/g.7435 Transcript_8412/m.7435 type:complete len:225 (+) Transcript_8412:948-1622(+)